MMSLKRHGILHSDSRQEGKVRCDHFAWKRGSKGPPLFPVPTLRKSRICSLRTSLGSYIPQNKQEQTGKICQSQHPINICSLFFHLKSERH